MDWRETTLLALTLLAACISPISGIHDVIEVYTPDYSESYRYVKGLAFDNGYIVFMVKTCHNAHILLSAEENLAETSDKTYEIVLGAHENFFTEIRVGGEMKAQKKTNAMMEKTGMRTFWIMWKDNYVDVGRGFIQGYDRLIHWKIEEPYKHDVAAIAFHTGYECEGTWMFKESKVATKALGMDDFSNESEGNIIVYTPTQFKYRLIKEFFEDQNDRPTSIIFSVKACKNAMIALSRYPTSTNIDTTDIVIGADNRDCKMRTRKPTSKLIRKEAQVKDILNCHQWRWFWLSWNDGNIRFGSGREVGENVVLEWSPVEGEKHDVISIWSSTQFTEGEWHFPGLDQM
ncbi:unnamed protein product [Owenia fusiformis]|uniref:Farnesoic acid O-methyl transferase domain-containing protein n=1 Tax=Owenia fusiformis TaxID=6347 RepID=A0A8J1Y5I1_OWEFU|nr:unnamed protein product [Owenia fusiformis]